MAGGIYIHVPFCKTRCIYCDFYSTTQSEEWKSRYVSSLSREMQCRRFELSHARANTIYVGGGTPSQLSPRMLQRVFQSLSDCFEIAADAEVTVEANPDDVTEDWIDSLRDTPVNRISMGVQSFDNNLLIFLRRRHTAEKARKAVDMCVNAGYTNVSIDLIYGIPGQSLSMWQKDLGVALSLPITHLSSYALQIEEHTLLGRLVKERKTIPADDELSLSMYECLMDVTSAEGMEHYEISNFCLPGKRSRHNSSYWMQIPYLGLGPGAHSYDGGRVRRWNNSSLKEYVAAETDVPHGGEVLTDDELYNELVMTRLRTKEGLPMGILNAERRAYCEKMSRLHVENGRLQFSNGNLSLTKAGIFVSDDIISDLIC